MKHLLPVLLMSSLSTVAFGKVIVQSLDKNVDLNQLSSEDYDKKVGLPPIPETKPQLPLPGVIEKMFTEAKLTEETKKMDQLDKDLLFRKARRVKAQELFAAYPAIPKEKLSMLQKLIKSSQK